MSAPHRPATAPIPANAIGAGIGGGLLAHRRASSLLLAALAAAMPRAQDSDSVRRVTVPLHDGRVEGRDLVRALLREYELDADAIPLPDFRVDLRGAKGLWILVGRES